MSYHRSVKILIAVLDCIRLTAGILLAVVIPFAWICRDGLGPDMHESTGFEAIAKTFSSAEVWIIAFAFIALSAAVRFLSTRGAGEKKFAKWSWRESAYAFAIAVLLCLLGVSINLLARHYGTLWWHIGNMILAPASFVLFSGFNMKFNRFCLLGGTYPFFIYIVHPLVISYYMSVRQNPSAVELWLRPFIVLAATVLLATVYYQSKSWLGMLFKHPNR